MPGFELLGDEEKKAVSSIFDEGAVLFAHGFDNIRARYHVREFEQHLSSYFNSLYVHCVSSGTAALKCALKSIGIKPGDQVITQAFNFIATIEAIVDCGATPIIANVDKDLYIDIADAESLITDRTKAIVSVHMLGAGSNPIEIQQLCEKHSLLHVEDNCESVGATFDNVPLGSFSDVSVISMDQGKMIACGEGGAVITSSKDIYNYVRSYSDHGHAYNSSLPRGLDPRVMPGFNYRMTEIQAAIGKVQLSKLPTMLTANEQRYSILHDLLSPHFYIRNTHELIIPNYDTFLFLVPDESHRNSILESIGSLGFGTKNLPGATEWHCSYFWDHVLEPSQIQHSRRTAELLSQYIALPILLRKTETDYKALAHSIIRSTLR